MLHSIIDPDIPGETRLKFKMALVFNRILQKLNVSSFLVLVSEQSLHIL